MTSNVEVSAKNQNLAKQSVEKLFKRQDIGFFQLPSSPELFQESQTLGSELRKSFTDLVVVGVGGSSLGPKSIHEVYFDLSASHQLHFCDNTDAEVFYRLLKSLQHTKDLRKVAWVFISKSGSTLETLAALDYIHQFYNKIGLQFYSNTFFLTERKSNLLFDLAQKHDRPVLEIPQNVGGRFSVLTSVGMLPAAFLGLNVEGFRKGAQQACQAKELVTTLVAHTLQSFEREEWITLFWHYSSLMRYFGAWMQQLWAESLSKEKNNHGRAAARASTPLTAIGACDQHSILQQVIAGAKDKFVIFVRVGSAESSSELLHETAFSQHKYLLNKNLGQILAAEAQATAGALSQKNISNLVLYVPDLSEQSLGFLFMYWELVVATIGEALEINAFDQPGVELGKRLAKQILNPS